jgi:ABC-2 type transport system permease protein
LNPILVIARREFRHTVGRPFFLLVVFGLPFLSFACLASVPLLAKDQPGSEVSFEQMAQEVTTQKNYLVPEGYVDKSGIVQAMPQTYASQFEVYPDEISAREALEFGEISAYILVHEDYLESGALTYVQSEFNPFLAITRSTTIRQVLNINLLGGDENLAALVQNPLNLELIILNPGSDRDPTNPVNLITPYITAAIFYMLIFLTSSILLVGISREKENRLLEILIASVSPRQLISGKMLGLGLVGLFEILAWIGTGMAILQLSDSSFDLSLEFQLPLSFLGWSVLYFLLGYAVYACLMAGIGALTPNLSQGSQLSTLLVIPLIIPLAMFSTFLYDPNGPIAVALSLFPFTAPVAMMSRLSASSQVPLWQILLSVTILALTVVLIIQVTARAFHAQVLLSGQSISLESLVQAFSNRH